MATFSMEGPVLVPVDFSEDSIQAVRNTLTLVPSPDALHVVTVLAEGSGGDDELALSNLRAELDRVLDDEVSRGIQVHAAVGEPAEEICAMAARVGAKTIVIPAHGRDAKPGDEIGSVTERVVRRAKCQVLVVGRRA